jgi:two-component system, LytTR family, sensor histidine kinase AlgZ
MTAAAPAPEGRRDSPPQFFLPDFCEARAVFAIVLIAALVGLVLALARQPEENAFWFDLARTSAFLLWSGLLCAAVLCRARPWLASRSVSTGTTLALLLLVGTVAALSLAVHLLAQLWPARLGTPLLPLPRSPWDFVLPNVMITVVVGALALRYFYVAHQWRRSVELEARARIRALQARIRPHFLFNSMNTIASLTRTNPAQAEAAIEDLSDLFRVNLSDGRSQISLEEEVEVARTYQRIEQLRLGERLQVRWDVGDLPPQCVVPSLLLQPLLENAIGHGIEPLPQGGVIDVRGQVEDDMITLEVTNPKPTGKPPARRGGHRMALDNIRQRLELVFPGRSSVDVEETEGRYAVRLRFPRFEPAPGSGWTGLADTITLRS